ncbi:hypothetical protein MKZ38_001126 [Zalerion maritima]|uniref:DUF7707 domain-containing protein n=1 Tax=Zalerion maritima TaxID=339359 RepID=A0AAD5RQK1_9PEZI|nr:hypothetical protein MKZ38_001126 [Zalerion maritima]
MRPFITLAALCGVASAATTGNYTVNPSDIDTSDKATWCNSQFNTCSTLCDAGGDGTETDTCDSETLEYDCTCNNGTAPGLEYYSNSMDSILCQKTFELCIEDTVGDSAGQSACKTDIQDTCGDLDPNDAEASTDNSDSSASTTGTSTATTTADASDSTDTVDSAAAPIYHYGKAAGAVAIGLMAYML